MGAVLAVAARLVASTAAWIAVEKIMTALIENPDETLIDDFVALLISAGTFKATDAKLLSKFFKTIPAPTNTLTGKKVETAEDVFQYFKALDESKLAKEALNKRLGGFAPLVVSLLTKLQNLFTVKGKIKLGLAGALVSIPTFILWSPTIIGNYLDQGTFAPEQANKIFEALGLPFRWPISEVREVQTALEAEKLDYYSGKNTVTGGGGVAGTDLPKTIIRMTEEKKPQQFLGTIFSAKLDKPEYFDRTPLDEITNTEELLADVKINLNRWLKSLPGRMGYSVVIRKDPVDEFGVQQSGIWATLTLLVTHISGKTTPIDTILLGPVSPQVRLELTKSTKTIESQIPGLISGQEVREIEVPNGTVDIFSSTGERVSPSTMSSTATTPPEKTQVSTERQPGETTAEQRNRLEETAKKLQKELEARQSKPTGLAGRYIVSGLGGSNLNIRSDPSTSARVIGQLREGDSFDASGESALANGFTWLKGSVSGRVSATNVWAANEFLRKA